MSNWQALCGAVRSAGPLDRERSALSTFPAFAALPTAYVDGDAPLALSADDVNTPMLANFDADSDLLRRAIKQFEVLAP